MRTLLTFFSSEIFGGPHNELSRIAKYVRNQEWKMVVVIPTENDKTRAAFETEGIEVRVIPHMRLKMSVGNAYHYIKSLPENIAKVMRLMAELKPDLVQFYNFANLELLWVTYKSGIPSIWKIVDSRIPTLIGRSLVRILKNKVGLIMTTGKTLGSRHYGLRDIDSWEFYYPFFEQEYFIKQRPREEIRDLLGIKSTSIVFGMLANFNPQKRHSVLIESFSEVFKGNANFDLFLRGSTIINPRYFKKVQKCLVSRGINLDRAADLENGITPLEFLSAIDVHVLVSGKNSEGFPNTIAECMLTETVSICTDVGSIGDIVTDGINGIVLSSRWTKMELIEFLELIKCERIDLQFLKSKFTSSNQASARIVENISKQVNALEYALIKSK